MNTIWNEMQKRLDQLRATDMYRSERVTESPCTPRMKVQGKSCVCLCSNDYLNLAADPAMRDALIDGAKRWGVGSGASRLVSGTSAAHASLERTLADFKRTQGAMVTSTGWMANHAAIHAVVGKEDWIICDKLNHASIIDAARSCGARLSTFPHRDTQRLDDLLARRRNRYRRCLIVTDSLFSMDGDAAPLRELAEIKDRHDALLMIDEAHATGVFGECGTGLAEHAGVEDRIDIVVGTLSKAMGALGGFIAGPGVLIDTIRNTGRAYIYTTAPPAALCVAAEKAIEIIREQPQRRKKLRALAEELRNVLRDKGLRIGDSQSQIFPILIGDAAKAMSLSQSLFEQGFLAPAIRPPTVPRGTSRLRVSLSSGHDRSDLLRFADVLEKTLQLRSG